MKTLGDPDGVADLMALGDSDGATDSFALGKVENIVLGVVEGAIVHFEVTRLNSKTLVLLLRCTTSRVKPDAAFVSSTTLIVPTNSSFPSTKRA